MTSQELPDWPDLVAWAEAEVKSTLRGLPCQLRQRAREIPVTYEPQPNDALIAEGYDPDLLGLFVGPDFPTGDFGAADLPPQIILFLDNIWDFAEGDRSLYRQEVRTTLMHELGHYLGLDELDLEERGLE
jgi:predicted Zn-dependent protease with MMP-like domain